MEIVGFAALAALVVKVVGVLKSIGKDNNAVVTQVLVWGVGIGVLALAAAADVTQAIVIPGLDAAVGDLDFAGTVIAGLMLGSSGSFAYDALTKSKVREPSLLG